MNAVPIHVKRRLLSETAVPLTSCAHPMKGASSRCADEIPDPIETIADFIALGGSIVDSCGNLSITYDEQMSGKGCADDPKVLMRTYVITDDKDYA